MTVENVLPYVSYTANGTTKTYSIPFYVTDKTHFEVKKNDEAVNQNDYRYNSSSNSIVFNRPPNIGDKIEVTRKTASERGITYTTYNNTFRPEILNTDLDRIWWKLQELDLTDWSLGSKIDREIANTINQNNIKLNELKKYIEALINNATGTDFLPLLDRSIGTWSGQTQDIENKSFITQVYSYAELIKITGFEGRVAYVKDIGHYKYLSGSWQKIHDTTPTSVLIDADINETQDTLNDYILRSIIELKDKIIDLENTDEDFATLEDRLTDSLLKIDLPMIYSDSITMVFDAIPNYSSRDPISGTVSGIIFSDYQVELYSATDEFYHWQTANIQSDGTWAFTSSSPGAKQVRLIRKSDNEWVHTIENAVCTRSHRVALDTDPLVYAAMAERTYTYDQAVVACAMISQNHPSMNHYVYGLLSVVGNDGSVPFFVNRISAFVVDKYYRTGNAAWVYYALAYYLQKFPNGTYADEARSKLQLGMTWIEQYFISDINDPRYGLYRGGTGRYSGDGTIFDETYQIYWCACEHNLDMWFALNTLVDLGYTQYIERRDLVRNTIVSKLWSTQDNRLYTGINESGIDTSSYLDTSSWGGLFLLASGEVTKGKLVQNYLKKYKFSTIEASGYTPYMEQNRTKGIWVEGTAGAALYERALGNVTTNLNIIAKMRSLFSEYGYRDSLVDPNDETLTMWQQSCNTAWILLAYKPNGFMNVN